MSDDFHILKDGKYLSFDFREISLVSKNSSFKLKLKLHCNFNFKRFMEILVSPLKIENEEDIDGESEINISLEL